MFIFSRCTNDIITTFSYSFWFLTWKNPSRVSFPGSSLLCIVPGFSRSCQETYKEFKETPRNLQSSRESPKNKLMISSKVPFQNLSMSFWWALYDFFLAFWLDSYNLFDKILTSSYKKLKFSTSKLSSEKFPMSSRWVLWWLLYELHWDPNKFKLLNSS